MAYLRGSHLVVCIIAPAVFAGICSFASAQSNERLVLQPWEDSNIFNGSGSIMLQNRGKMETDPGGTHLLMAESSSRIRFSTKYPVSPAMGYDYILLSMSGHHEPIPAQLQDISVGAGTPFLETNGWFFMAGAGLGYAGDAAFGNGQAWYGRGWLVAGHEIDKSSQLIFFLDYNGNRTFWPDIPFPAGIYHKVVNDKFEFTLGPVMEAVWKPIDKLTLDVRYDIPTSVDAIAKYDLNRQWAIYSSFLNRYWAFHDEELPDNRRLFFHQSRVEGGVQFTPFKWGTITAAGGYAFDQEFKSGWDLGRTHHISDLSDELYVRLGLEFKF